MLRIDWRSPAAYSHTKTIHAAGFAWEYLRRNDEYREDFHSVTASEKLGKEQLEAFVQRWGLRFSKGP